TRDVPYRFVVVLVDWVRYSTTQARDERAAVARTPTAAGGQEDLVRACWSTAWNPPLADTQVRMSPSSSCRSPRLWSSALVNTAPSAPRDCAAKRSVPPGTRGAMALTAPASAGPHADVSAFGAHAPRATAMRHAPATARAVVIGRERR